MNHLIQACALFGRSDGRTSHGAWGERRHGPRRAAAIAGDLPLGERVVLRQVHANQLGREMQHQRRIELASVSGTGWIFEIAGEVEGEDVDGEYTSPARAQG